MKEQIIDVLIPISSNRFIPQVVLDHLFIQGYPLRFFMSNTEGDSAVDARESIKRMWQASEPTAHYVLMTDNDLILNPGSIDVMFEFLINNEDFAGIGLQRGLAPPGEPTEAIEPDHISAGPILYKSKYYKQISYYDEQQGCDCIRQARAIRKLGKRIGFLCGVTYQHINNTIWSDYER